MLRRLRRCWDSVSRKVEPPRRSNGGAPGVRWAAGLLLASVGCAEPLPPEERAPGAIAVSVVTTGYDLDPNAFAVQVDGALLQTIDHQGTRVFPDLPAGSHLVELVEVAENCNVSPPARRTVEVEPGRTATVTFVVTCLATGVVISARTIGIDLDPIYRVTIDGGDGGSLLPEQTTTVTRLAPERHDVGLTDVAPNCVVAGPNPQSVVLAANSVVPVAFSVTCLAATGLIKVTVATAGSDQDPSGYMVRVDEGGSAPLAPNGVTIVGLLPVGDHLVLLEQVAPNCTVVGDSPRLVAVTGGRPIRDTVQAAFQVTCASGLWKLAFTRNDFVTLGSADGAKTEPVAPGSQPAWSPDGTVLAYGCGGICLSRFDGQTQTVVWFAPGYASDPAWRPDGGRIAFGGWECVSTSYYDSYCTFDGLFLIAPDGTGRTRIRLPSGFVSASHLAWSPDGSHLAFECTPVATKDICIMNADGSGFRSLTTGFAGDGAPAWKPDGSKIAFHTTRFSGTSELALMNPDGTGITRLSPGTSAGYPAWSPDGHRIAFSAISRQDGRLLGISTMNADGSGVTQLTLGPDRAPTWRP